MKRYLAVALFVSATALFAFAAKKEKAAPPRPPDEAKTVSVAAALSEISEARLRADVERLAGGEKAGFWTRHTASWDNHPTRGVGAARRWILEEMKKAVAGSANETEVYEDWFEAGNERIEKQRMANVVAILHGKEATSRPRVYVVGGHYDSRVSDVKEANAHAPGANDDASGTAATMELLRVMSRLPLRATVVFAAFVGEEQGLLGSTHLAETAKERGWRVDGALALDVVGGTEGATGARDERTVRCFSAGEADADSLSREWARHIERCARKFVPDAFLKLVYRIDRHGRGGDHIPFHRAGFPAARLTEAVENYNRQHQDVREEGGIRYGDLPEFVDYPYLARVTRISAAALIEAAMAPAPPSDVAVRGAVSPDTTLSWTPSPDPFVSHYVVVMRDTAARDWEREIPAGNVSSFTLKDVVIDDHVFGVKSVSHDGFESRVQPARFAR